MSPGTRWVAIIVGLLVGNAIAVVLLVGVSSGEARRRVLPDYYQRAVAWDSTMAAARASADLGWQVGVDAQGREVTITVVDRGRAPVTDATVRLTAVPRGRVDATVAGAAVAVAPGVYRVALVGERGGLHDVALRIERGAEAFMDERVVELGRSDGAPAP